MDLEGTLNSVNPKATALKCSAAFTVARVLMSSMPNGLLFQTVYVIGGGVLTGALADNIDAASERIADRISELLSDVVMRNEPIQADFQEVKDQ